MKILVALLAAVYCIAAEPAILNYDYPYSYRHFDYSPIHYPLITKVIPDVVYPKVHHPVVPYYTGLKSQYYDRDLIGQARYGHIEPGQSHHAVQDAFGNKVGSFSYYNAEGLLKHTNYVADGAGYRVSSNDLPVESPEIKAAKVAHLSEHAKINLIRSKRDVPLTPASTVPLTSASTLPIGSPLTNIDYRITSGIWNGFPVVKSNGFLADTPEVTAAKIRHFALLAANKARSVSWPIIPQVSPISTTHSSYDYRFVSPYTHTTVPFITKDSFLLNTPEVTAEKTRYLTEIAKGKARVSYPWLF